MPTKLPNVNPLIWAEDRNLYTSGVHTIKMASMRANSLAPTKSLTTYTTSVRGWYGVNPSIRAESGSLHVPGIHTVKMAAVTDPKSVEWLRRVDLDQVISTFRQMQQFNSRNQENSEQILKISSSLLSLPPSEYAGRPNPQQHGSTKSTQIGKLRTHFC